MGCSRRPVGWSSRSVRTGSPTHGPTRLTRPRSRHLGFARAFERAVLAALLSNATPADAALLHEAWAARAAAATQGRPGAGTRGASHARPGRPPRSTQPSRSCTQLQHQHLGLHPARSRARARLVGVHVCRSVGGVVVKRQIHTTSTQHAADAGRELPRRRAR